MNIVILSGGSGNDALMQGLINHGYADSIKVITNAYDNGKSTGVCRVVTDTLGVSDIRKNHFRMYKYKYKNDLNQGLVEFYSGRYDLGENPEQFCIEKLENWGLSFLTDYVEAFFEFPLSKEFKEYKDFSISNIVYSAMYTRIGYEATHKYFCDLLGINDFVILNSLDNVYISATTKSGNYVRGEERIVEYKNSDDPIVKIRYSNDYYDGISLNPKAVELIESLSSDDLLIISTGTFWSSIYPTLDYGKFYEYVNKACCKKLWVINTEEDKDAYGVSSTKFIEYMEKLGLNLEEFTILHNLDGKESLYEAQKTYLGMCYAHMGNNNGKNDPELYYRAISSLYRLNEYDE
jgi:2-phospho-L-lactate transferase/gluconeogenesis factor (CofD/UPF0052 family)